MDPRGSANPPVFQRRNAVDRRHGRKEAANRKQNLLVLLPPLRNRANPPSLPRPLLAQHFRVRHDAGHAADAGPRSSSSLANRRGQFVRLVLLSRPQELPDNVMEGFGKRCLRSSLSFRLACTGPRVRRLPMNPIVGRTSQWDCSRFCSQISCSLGGEQAVACHCAVSRLPSCRSVAANFCNSRQWCMGNRSGEVTERVGHEQAKHSASFSRSQGI